MPLLCNARCPATFGVTQRSSPGWWPNPAQPSVTGRPAESAHCSSISFIAGGLLMSTAPDPSYHDEYTEAGDRPAPAGTRFTSEPAHRGAGEERLLAPAAAVPAAPPRRGVIPPEPADQPVLPDRQLIVARQQERFGGFKFGSAFFGWMA